MKICKLCTKKYSSGEITLWCDGTVITGKKWKREEPSLAPKFHEMEGEVEEIYNELVQKHSDSYDTPKLRLWAQMIASEAWMFLQLFQLLVEVSMLPRSHASILSSAAVAVTQVLKSDSRPEVSATALQVDLRMKNLQQLGYLKQLYDDNILTDAEFTEQKESILKAINKLN